MNVSDGKSVYKCSTWLDNNAIISVFSQQMRPRGFQKGMCSIKKTNSHVFLVFFGMLKKQLEITFHSKNAHRKYNSAKKF